MWFRVAEDMYLRMDDVVGFFGPDALPARWDNEAEGAVGGRRAGGNHAAHGAAEDALAGGSGRTDKTARAFALMRDGSAAQAPFGVRALAGRFKKAQDELKTITTGEEWQRPKNRP